MTTSDVSLACLSPVSDKDPPPDRVPALIRSASTYGSVELSERNKVCTSVAMHILYNPDISSRRDKFVTNLTSTLSYGWLLEDKVVEQFMELLDRDKEEESPIIAREDSARLNALRETLNMPEPIHELLNSYASRILR